MSNDESEQTRRFFRALLNLCSECRSKLGLTTSGPNSRPLPSHCECCELTAEAHGPRHVPARNGNA